MPSAPKRPCRHGGCPAITEGTYCDEHRKQMQNQESKDRRAKGERNPLYDTARWKRLRKMVLSRKPLCERCAKQGKTAAGTDVHHIRPLSERADLAYEFTNLEVLCHACHSSETAKEVGWTKRKLDTDSAGGV